MAASLYIVVEGEDPGFDIFVDGNALARSEDALERLSGRLDVNPLLGFFSADEAPAVRPAAFGAEDVGHLSSILAAKDQEARFSAPLRMTGGDDAAPGLQRRWECASRRRWLRLWG